MPSWNRLSPSDRYALVQTQVMLLALVGVAAYLLATRESPVAGRDPRGLVRGDVRLDDRPHPQP